MPSLTLADLQARVYARLDGNTALYQTREVNTAVNEAIKILNLMTGFLQITLEIPEWSVPNRLYYDVPPQIAIPTRVQYEKDYLTPTSLNDIGRAHRNWTTHTTRNRMMPVSYWIPIGLTKFAIYPADTIGGQQILVSGVLAPRPLVNPTDICPFPNQLLTIFDTLAVHTLQLKESSQDFQQAAADYQEFLRIMKTLIVWTGFKSPKFYIESQQPVKR